MRKELAVDIVDACQREGIEAELYEDYSGRGMFGETTTGVVLPQYTKVRDMIKACIEHDVSYNMFTGFEAVCEEDFRRDSLGFNTIIY